MTSFSEFLNQRLAQGGFTTEDVLTSLLPLVRQTAAAHAAGLVAPLAGIDFLKVDATRIMFDDTRRSAPTRSDSQLKALEREVSRAVEVVGELTFTVQVSEGQESIVNLQIGQRGQPITCPVYLPGYVSWEHEIGHHDPLTDIFSLGLILATLACGLDLTVPENLKSFVAHRQSLFDLNSDLHPVLAKIIVRMTELDRRKRPQDLAALLSTLENYREQNIDFEYELTRTAGFRETNLSGKRRTVLATLQRRLFEITRRNRLLHFRPTMQTVNLTVASVPLSFDVGTIRPEQILTWNEPLHDKVVAGKSLSLNSLLRFEEAVYLPGLLDRIRLEAQRDQVEFGFAQLRLVLCFLRWSNLKEKPPERFDSPLLLLPVQLVKKKGVRDTFALEIQSAEAEVNPVLRYYFKHLYDIALPEALDLSATTLDAFHEFLAAKVQQSEPAVTLQKIDRPRIQLIHAKAQRRLDQYVQRSRISGRGVRTFQDLDYSYEKDNFQPLGLRLYQARIQHRPTNLQSVIQQAPQRRSYAVAQSSSGAPEVEQERHLYALNEPDESNPYRWEYDLCSLTLGNFRYRRFSLVRDYAALLEHDPSHPVFDAVFSLAPREVEPESATPALADSYPVLTCDPTQSSAIGRARAGKSYIIQGPPGTGKSQTIANLIADFVSRGQRVLFVCEKRAAIDVVYHRLQQNGLHLLCSLIHDSQEDKKEFIMDLKQTYEAFMEHAGRKTEPSGRQRGQLLTILQRELKPLEDFQRAMNSATSSSAIPLRQLLERLITLRPNMPELSNEDQERLPAYALWCYHHERVERLAALLEDMHGNPVLAHHPLRRLSTNMVKAERPLETVNAHLLEADGLIARLETCLQAIGLLPDECNTVEKVSQLVHYAEQMRCLAEKSLLPLLIPDSAQSKKLEAFVKDYRKKARVLAEAQAGTTSWRHKLAPAELTVAIEQAREFEGHLLAFLRPAWWRLRGVLERSYDFKSHQLKPTFSQVLAGLQREYQAQADLDAIEAVAKETFDYAEPLSSLAAKVQELRDVSARLPAFIRETQLRLLMKGEADQAVTRAAELRPDVEQLRNEISALLDGCNSMTFAELVKEFDQIEAALDDLPDFMVCLKEAAALRPELLAVLREMPLSPVELEAALARRTWEEICRVDRELNRFTERVRSRHVRKLARVIAELHAANANALCESVRKSFLDHVRIAGLPHADLTSEEKEFKTAFNRGRRELEHEFGKVMRYRSIRELVTGDSGLIIKDLKPVWLMSPLSASDALPLDPNHFDVVIFDEASQVTLEGAVPSLFRARQTIVVGDQMQLPPTNFFAAKQPEGQENSEQEEEGNEDTVENDLEANSFLAYSARVLPSTMLGWHYRSRSESLISFSNAAFYQGRLLTVPDKKLPATGWTEIEATSASQGTDHLLHLLERPVSFHFLPTGVYENRRNTAEAAYIANLVRALLTRRSGLSIGIIAFSETQQGEILDALMRLGDEDESFRERLESEFEREERGQFVGLLVKNLENIQGDERDVVILSVCYGRNPGGKMLMNFGPINQTGGEKRLNVAFSRAKQYMAVVSSIHHPEITNDYNLGARCLKNYLRYAAAASTGQVETMEQVLREMLVRPDELALAHERKKDLVREQVAAGLREKGYEVDTDVGQSSFRCDLAVRLPHESEYAAAILVDTSKASDTTDLLELEVMRPKLLEAFGWRVAHVIAKDWYTDPKVVIGDLTNFIERAQPDVQSTVIKQEIRKPRR